MLVTGISGVTLDQLFSVFEFDAVDDIFFLKRQEHSIESVRLSKGWAYQLSKTGQKLQAKGGLHK